jgi:hypothetical protein
MSVLRLSLHLDGDGDVVGGGWAFYNPADCLVAAEAYPAFEGLPMAADEACREIYGRFLDVRGHQLAF